MSSAPLNTFFARWSAASASDPVKAVAAAEVAKQFSRAKPEDVAEILDALCTVGLAHHGKEKRTYSP